MPPPVRADYDAKERRVIERASEETKRMNEHMDKIDANLDNMSDNLKQRFKQVVISQLSLMKYRQEDTFADSLNVYKKEVSKVEYQPKTTTATNCRSSKVKKEIQRWNTNIESHQQDFKGEEQYSHKISTVGRSANSPVSDTSNKITASPNFDAESVKNRAISDSNKGRLDIKTGKPDRVIDIKQATKNVREDNIKPTTVGASPASFKGNTETGNAFNDASRKDQISTAVETSPNDIIHVLRNNQKISTSPEYTCRIRRETTSPSLGGRITPDPARRLINNFASESPVNKGDQNNTKNAMKDPEGKMTVLNNKTTGTNREMKTSNDNATASEFKTKRTVNVTGLSAEKRLHTIDKNDAFYNTKLGYRENVASVDVGTKDASNYKTSPTSKNVTNRSLEPNTSPVGLTTINDIHNVRLSRAFKDYMSNITGTQLVTQDTSTVRTSPVAKGDMVDSQGAGLASFSTPISEKYDSHKPSLSFSPILATTKTPLKTSRKQTQSESMQPSSVKQTRPEKMQPSPGKQSRPESMQPSPGKQSRPESMQPSLVKQNRPEKMQPSPVKQNRPEKMQPSSVKQNQSEKMQPSPVKQNPSEKLQPSPVKQKLQSLVSDLGEYNEQAHIQTADAREVLSRIQDNDAPQTQPRSLASSYAPKLNTVETSNESQNGPSRQTSSRDSDNVVSNIRNHQNMSDIDDHAIGRISTDDSTYVHNDNSTTGNRTPSTELPSALRFQSTIKYTPIVDSSIAPTSIKHSLYCSDCSDPTGNTEQVRRKGVQHENEEISVADIEKDAAKEKITVNKCKDRVGIFERNGTSTQAARGFSTIDDYRTHTNRNNGSFIETNPSPRDGTVRQTKISEAGNDHTKNLPKYTTDDEFVRMTSTSSNPARGTKGLQDMLPNKAIHGLGQAKKKTSSLIGAYETIKMKLYNSALNSLMSSMKSTVEENVDRDFDREMWTALNRSVTEMTEEFESYVSGIGSQNTDTWSVNMAHLDRLLQRLLSEGPCSDRLRLKVDVEDAMCRLRSHLEDSSRERRNLSSEVEKILATLKNLTECLAVCGDRYFGDVSRRKRQNPQGIDTWCENVESTSVTNGFLATANSIRQRLISGYTTWKVADSTVRTQDKDENEWRPAAEGNVRYKHVKENHPHDSGQMMATSSSLDETPAIIVQPNIAASETEDVLARNNDEISEQTTATGQQQASPRNRSPQRHHPHSISQRRMYDFRNYGLLILIIFATAKFFAHFGPGFLQVIHDILVGIMMYISCNVRLVHFEPNFT